MRALVLLPLLAACSGGDTDEVVEPGPFRVTQGDPEDCEPSAALAPASDDDINTWAVARLDPPGTPARLDEVVVRFDNRLPCTTAQPSLVRASIDAGDLPAEPDFVGAATLDASDGSSAIIVTIPLSDGPVVEEGESIFVHARYTGDPNGMRCVTLCQDTDRSDAVWWSGASEVPFSPRTIASDGTSGQLAVAVSGEVLAPAEGE